MGLFPSLGSFLTDSANMLQWLLMNNILETSLTLVFFPGNLIPMRVLGICYVLSIVWSSL